MFDGKAQAAAAEARLEAQLDHLRGENERLWKQVEKLQEALFARESPLAYGQMKMDEAALADPAIPMSDEELQRKKIESEVLTNRLYNCEKSLGELFDEDPEALTSALLKTIGAPIPQALHDNDES